MSRMKAIAFLPLIGLPFYGCQDNASNGGGEIAGAKDSASARLTPSPWRELAKDMKQGDTSFIAEDSVNLQKAGSVTRYFRDNHKFEKKSAAADYPFVRICSNINYGGTCWDLPQGYYYNNLNYGLGGFNDAISSIKFYNGANPYFCVDSDWRGTCLQFSADVPDLRAYNFNDVITSIKWQKDGQNGVTVYEDANYGGRAYTLIYPFDYNEMPSWTDNRVSSYKVLPLIPLPNFYTDPEWTGSIYPADNFSTYVGDSFNDSFSSIEWLNQ